MKSLSIFFVVFCPFLIILFIFYLYKQNKHLKQTFKTVFNDLNKKQDTNPALIIIFELSNSLQSWEVDFLMFLESLLKQHI